MVIRFSDAYVNNNFNRVTVFVLDGEYLRARSIFFWVVIVVDGELRANILWNNEVLMGKKFILVLFM